MKKILFSILLFSGLSASAQLPDGSIAPDFTLTDIDGVTHHLYDYLDAGKTVYIDISATWCAPCWGFHGSHALDQLYADHGPAGDAGVSASTTDDVIVLFVEGDGSTNSADLHGTGTNTQGDWVTGGDYPIIDPPSAQINQFNYNYGLAYYPTMYMICPNRRITEIGVSPDGQYYYTGAQMYALAGDCPAPASQATDVSAIDYKGAPTVCGPTSYMPIVEIQNNGTTALTAANITIKIGGTTVSTGTYSGNLATYGVANVTCTPIANFTSGNLAIEVTTTSDGDATNNTINFNVIGAIETESRILFTITTDGYADETSWSIRDENSAPVSGTTNPTLANSTTYNFIYDLPAVGCYTLKMQDSYGDGLIGSGTINVRDANNVILLNTPDYGSLKSVPFKVTAMTDLTGIDEESVMNFDIDAYPNPSNGNTNIKVDLEQSSTVAVNVYNVVGKLVYQVPVEKLAAGAHVYPIKLNVKSGVYFAHISVNGTKQIVKLNVVK